MSDINPDFLLGLAQLETQGGKRAVPGTNNLYNIKDFSGGGVKAFDKAEGSNDGYRVFNSPEESTAHLMGLLQQKYPAALTAKTPQEFAQALKDGGYATDPHYVEKLTNVIVGGKFDPAAMKAAGASAPGPSLTSAGEWDTPMLGAGARQAARTRHSPAVDSDGNPVNLTPQEKVGVLRAGIEQGPSGASAARHDPDAAAILGTPRASNVLDQGQDSFGAAKGASDAETALAETARNTPIRDMIGAAAMGGSIGALVRLNSREEHGPAIPGFAPPDTDLAGKTEEQQRELLAARNPGDLNRIKFDQDETAARERTISAKGGWTSFGVQMLATLGDPLSYVLPYAASRSLAVAGIGSAALARSGKGLEAGIAAFGENAVANIAQDNIVASAVDEHRSWGDNAMAAATALLPGVIHGASGWAAGHRIEVAEGVMRAREGVIAKEEQYARRAAGNLGADATPDQIRAEMDRLQTEDIKGVVQGNTTRALDENRQLLPDSEKVAAEIEAEDKALAEAGTQKAGDVTNPQTVTHSSEAPVWDKANERLDASRMETMNTKWANQLAEVEGLRMNWLTRQTEGVHVLPALAGNSRLKVAVDVAKDLGRQFLPDSKLALGIVKERQVTVGKGHPEGGTVSHVNPQYEAIVYSAGKHHAIGLRDNLSTHDSVTSVVHEVGHAIFHEFARDIPPGLLGRMVDEHAAFLTELKTGKATARLKRYAEGSASVLTEDGKLRGGLMNTKYNASFDEYTAEAFTRFIQRRAREGGVTLPEQAVSLLKQAWEKVKALYDYARGKNYLAKDEAFDEFFDRVMKGSLKNADRDADALRTKAAAPEFLAPDLQIPGSMAQHTPPALGALPAATDVETRNGLHLLPEDTPEMRGEKKALVHLYQRAEAWALANPKDAAWEARANSLNDNNVFNVASTGLLMLKSDNPVVRMVASELLEDAGGVAGHRQSTAAISKHMHERLFLGNSINELQDHYDVWKRDNGGSLYSDLMDGRNNAAFNRAIAEEIEYRRVNGGRTTGTAHPSVIGGADSLERAYERMRTAQVNSKTLGWAALPESSKGYMPHKMSSTKVRALTNEQQGILHTTLMDQFINIEGWDISFAANLASKYLDRVKQKALGGYDAPIGIHETGASDVVEDALTAMGLTRQEVHAQMGRYLAGGPGHTKKRLNLDLNQTHTTADGTQFRLLDLFETDQMKLLRSQAHRVSGEVALARHGVIGKPGLALIRRGMGYGADGQRALPRELEAFDQVSAEFMGEPFGSQEGKWLERARTLNGVARLGGIVFNQFAEFINGIAHVGTGRTLSAIGGINRLRGEIIALSKGEKVDNPLLTSIEHMGGAEFGTDAYKIAFPFDTPDSVHPTYGRDTITATDRILRGAGHVQAKISFWRAVHSSQQRGFAEQIVQKAVQFIKSGSDDAALNDMGIHAGLRQRLSADIDQMARFDASGRLTEFDLMKARDVGAANDFVHAVHRGVSQIIQSNFIGEQGKWAHSGYLKMLTQFRSFSILSVEKQWARQRNNQGTAKALGILLGSMSIAVPVYMARVYASSVGRADQQEYLERNLHPYQLTRATMNYVALSGLAGDFADALTAIAPDSVQEVIGTPTGGRTGTTKTAVGNLIAPAAGYVDDVWGALQNMDKPEKAAKILPFSRVPYLIPAINALSH